MTLSVHIVMQTSTAMNESHDSKSFLDRLVAQSVNLAVFGDAAGVANNCVLAIDMKRWRSAGSETGVQDPDMRKKPYFALQGRLKSDRRTCCR